MCKQLLHEGTISDQIWDPQQWDPNQKRQHWYFQQPILIWIKQVAIIFSIMSERLHKDLMLKTKVQSQTMWMFAEMLNKLREKMPANVMQEALSNKELEFRREIEAGGFKLDPSFHEIVRSMKANNFDLLKDIKRSARSLQDYYHTKTEEQKPSTNLTSTVLMQMKLTPKKKKIKKSAKLRRLGKKIRVEIEEREPIFEEDQDQCEDDFGIK